jgi:hypothetical protein
MSILLVGFLRDDKAIEDMLEVLKVGHVTTRTNDRIVPNRVQTLHALKTCKRAIGGLNGRCVKWAEHHGGRA